MTGMGIELEVLVPLFVGIAAGLIAALIARILKGYGWRTLLGVAVIFFVIGVIVAWIIDPSPTLVEVPDILGYSEGDAKKIIEEKDLVFNVVERRHSDTVQKYKVISQDPSPGLRVNKDSIVNVVVSIGPKTTPTSTQKPTHTPTPTTTPTLTPTPIVMPTLTPTHTETPPSTTTNSIDPMESTMGWYTHKGDKGSSINRKLIPGRTDNGIGISYDLKEWGWVLISKNINPEKLSKYEGIRFYYKGSGEPNTIELKLIYEDTTTFGVVWHGATVADDWVSVEVPYSDFYCWWPANNCLRYGNELDLEKVRKIEFTISNKPDDGDVYGSGWVIIDDVQGIAP